MCHDFKVVPLLVPRLELVAPWAPFGPCCLGCRVDLEGLDESLVFHRGGHEL